ncbi:Clan CD, family C14, metacaspase-like cysteine peptidase, partial [Trichomonas vaginalis G3]
EQFLHYLDYFFKNTTKHLALFYVGHGTNVKDLDGDEDDGFDEALFFVNGVVVDDVLIDHLIKHKNPESVLTLITDACHSGTIWDIQSGNCNGRELPAKIMSISAAADKQTAKQTVVERVEQGMFSYNFEKLIKQDANLKPRDLKRGIKTALQKYGQTCAIATTSAELLDIPIMQP